MSSVLFTVTISSWTGGGEHKLEEVVGVSISLLSEEVGDRGGGLPVSPTPIPFAFSRTFWCVFTCLLRWSLLMNRLLHSGHMNRFSPVWVRRWRWSSSERVNLFPQNNQLQTNGRSWLKIEQVTVSGGGDIGLATITLCVCVCARVS